MSEPCNCFVARHPKVADIDAALQAREDPRAIAERFGVGKSRVYDHRRHLGITGPAPDAPAVSEAPAVKPAPPPPSHPAQAPPAAPVQPPVERVEPFHGTVERRVESGGMSVARSLTEPTITPRALPAEPAPQSAYAMAVQTVIGLKVNGAWRATHVDAIAQKTGLAKSSVRAAHAEAVRHLQMGMGDFLARQATSALWVTKERDAAKDQQMAAQKNAERWRRQEREAQEAADKLTDKERFAMLETAARFGMLATKYDLSAEKWGGQALAHQRHHDDVLCLRSPREVNATQINVGGGTDDVARFASALARRFADRPDVLAALEAAAADIEREEPGDGAIVVTGEAA